MIKKFIDWYDLIVAKIAKFDFIPLLAMRIYLAPVIFVGARSKFLGFEHTVTWFADELHLPFPFLLAILATTAEILGLVCITLGLFTRIMSVVMGIVMISASLLVHWSHGWLAIASNDMESSQRLSIFLEWLKVNFPGRYNYITELGDPIILNNGIEFATTYFIMFMVLLVYGGGRYISVDYWLKRFFTKPTQAL